MLQNKLLSRALLNFLLYLSSLTCLSAQQKYDIVVAQDGSGSYRTVQEAVTSVPDFSDRQITIFVKNGVYKEKLLIPAWKTNIKLIGESAEKTIITYDDHSGKEDPCGNGKINTFTSYTVKVEGDDFSAENITFENAAGPVGQALALYVSADRCVFRNCRLLGNQDTLYATGEHSRQYYVNCYIEGTTDFIFGSATAVFENCTIHVKRNSYITAASTTSNQDFGFVFLNCKVTGIPGLEKVYLGRPWRNFAATTFLNTELNVPVQPEGWHNWSRPYREKTSRYAEYNSSGQGANPDARVKWAKQLSKDEARLYTAKNILIGSDGWNPTDDIN